ncbi:hypothetical protein GGR53DRAFT_256343 [Hypoxylon sp. FL1150]|nr:hypothetical protein GGR53DRAFT_256343 [Hypoxylon sp. FL1150]
MDWRSFSFILFYVKSLKVLGLSFRWLGSWKNFLALGVRRARTQEGEFSPLAELLFEHRRGKATDPRDRIFGLMGLSAEREEMSTANYTRAGYTASIASVFTDATIDILRRSGNLDILGLVGSVRPGRPEDLPSWVPDYGIPQGPHPITKRGMLYTSSKKRQVSVKFAAGGHFQHSFVIDGRALVIPALIIGEIHELAECCGGQPDDDVGVQNGLGKVILAYASKGLQDQVEGINTSLSWERFARRYIGTSPVYKPTGESMQDTFLMTYYEGQAENITDEIRAVNTIERFAITVWRILTLGFGCTWLPVAMPLAAIAGFVVWISRPVWSFLGYPSVSTLERYADMTKDAIDRRPCITKNGLVGLAPPDSVPGDRLALLQGGRVPVVLRQDVDGYRLIGEAYVHGAMYGEMFDDQKAAKIRIK